MCVKKKTQTEIGFSILLLNLFGMCKAFVCVVGGGGLHELT
jgi:hypothetical protein